MTELCPMCGEDFDPETSRYDDVCSECADQLDDELGEVCEP